ncbi:hypothetical protein JOM56_006359 [Amanita muscaria]
MASDMLKLNCWAFGDPLTDTIFVKIQKTTTVSDLKDEIRERIPVFQNIHLGTLDLWQVSIPGGTSIEDFEQNIQTLLVGVLENQQPMFSLALLSQYFLEAPKYGHLHIVARPRDGSGCQCSCICVELMIMLLPRTAYSFAVTTGTSLSNEPFRVANAPRSPRTPEYRPAKHRMERNEMLHSHPAALLQLQESPPRMRSKEIEPTMVATLEPFAKYITSLAIGELDGYFNSICPEDLVTDLQEELDLPRQPMLLLHDLGKYTDHEITKRLFAYGTTVHLFAVSGSGKTRRALEGLCHNWGFYISCRPPIGSRDFEAATNIMMSMSKWDNAKGADNAKVAERAFAMLICARVFVLKCLLTNLPAGTDAVVARKRWVLAQVLPPALPFSKYDIFAAIVNRLRSADTVDMLNLASTMLLETAEKVGDQIFSKTTPLFAVVDEAQVAAVYLDDYFRSITTGTDMRPVLHPLFGFLWESKIIKGVIVAGTGLSMETVRTTLSSQAAKYTGSHQVPLVSVELGRFTKEGTVHEEYIRKYLSYLSNQSVSDKRLVERILYWFSGRYRFTATLIELLLYAQSGSQHRVLTTLVHSLTRFTITDALELEEKEPPLATDTVTKIQSYGKISGVDRLFKQESRERLILSLLDVLLRWRIGSQPTHLPIEGDVHEIVALGIGHLKTVESDKTLDSGHYSVYLCEPLSVLDLSSAFENYSWTKKEEWIASAFRTARNNSSRGFVFEEVVLLVLLQIFGGKSCPLSDAFHCDQPWGWGSRNVTLVSLKRGSDDILQSSPVSWTSGSSDRVGFKAASPTEVLQFLNNPDGKGFLFPDVHMGPDLLCFLQDVETSELILLAVQAKVSPTLVANAWRSALDSITPQFFYTVKTVCGRAQYAPLAYPDLSNDIMDALDWALGPSEFKAAIDLDGYRQKLRSSTVQNQRLAPLPPRKTPKLLRIIATCDDDQKHRLKAEWKGDVGVLRWNLVEQYLGSTADVVMTASQSVP